MPLKLIAGGGGDQAIEDFRIALRKHPDAVNLLLIDSEGPFRDRLFEERCQSQRIGFQHKDRVFWMVQCMEAWFLADLAALREVFGTSLRETALRGNPNVEEIRKYDVLERMKSATEGRYHKTRHAPELLRRINPGRVKDASAQCRRIFEALPKLASTDRS